MSRPARVVRSAAPATGSAIRVVGYLRVSTSEQADSGAGLDAQRAAITAEAARRGWVLVEVFVDAGLSGKSLNRPGLDAALTAVTTGAADVLVVAKLDRLSRSVVDFAGLLDRALREGWGVVALDLGVDTTTPAGELVANVMAAVAQWERRVIGQRTKDGLAAKREAGVRLGRPGALPAEVVARVVAEREAGRTCQAIADQLNADRVPTARAVGPWLPGAVHAVSRSQAARALAA
ncbi:MAG TPA: recombinase family protein [Trebonia sp.]